MTYQNLEPLEQFELVCMVSGACVLVAIVLREYFADQHIRIMARGLGLIGFILLASFGWRMAAKVERLETRAVQPIQVDEHHVYAASN